MTILTHEYAERASPQNFTPNETIMGSGFKRFRTVEICKLYDVSRATLFRWEREGLITEPPRDWRNWRTYTGRNIKEIQQLIKTRNAGR